MTREFQIGDIVRFSESKTFAENSDSIGIITNIEPNYKTEYVEQNYIAYSVWWFDIEKTYNGYSISELEKISE